MSRRFTKGESVDASGGAVTNQIIATAPVGHKLVLSLVHVANRGAASTFSVSWVRNSDQVYMAKDATLPANGFVSLGQSGRDWVVLEDGDTLRVDVASGAVADFTYSYELIRGQSIG